MLVGPGRGSSSGSLVCYVTFITEIDPIVHSSLLFERFIDFTRKDLPDIDIDFSDVKRDMVFDYLAKKYGQKNVARIGNINTLKPRSVLNEVCKRFAIPPLEKFKVLDVLADYSSGDSRFGHGLHDTLTATDNGKDFVKRYPESFVMTEVENHSWHTGVHAAGVIVSTEPVSNYCTVNAEGVAQIDKPDSEALQLLKIDALGLRTLGIIEDANVVTADELYALTTDDPKVFDIFNQKRYSCIFQFEGATQRVVAEQVPVDSFKVIDHITALARPGPLGGGATEKYIARAGGRERVEYIHDKLVAPTEDTLGLILYQEQVMACVREIGHFSWEDTTIIRKAMSARKGKEFFDRKGELFVEGAKLEGVPPDDAAAIWMSICQFGSWGMNRCFFKNTRIKLCHPNQFLGPDPTIEELYNYYKVNPSSWIRQRKSMPLLLSMNGDRAWPTEAVDIFKTGLKKCSRLTFSDGKVVECTLEHKFIINGNWKPCGEAAIGDCFTSMTRDHASKDVGHKELRGKGKGWRASRIGAGPTDMVSGKVTYANEFKKLHKDDPCEDCGEIKKRMEAHHNDHNGGLDRPKDLVWLCSSCHKKRHIAYGDRRAPYARGWMLDEPAILLSVEDIGEHETYDIEMPEPNHNFLLANGIVTHNSHTCAYAKISYWCAYMKAYHPLEFAAACLRGAKDDDNALEILREMDQEGTKYTPFDIDLSEVHWSVKEGKLIGGFQNLVGFGPAKAVTAVEARRLGTMSEKMRERIENSRIKFTKLYPLHEEFGDLYKHPEDWGCEYGSKVVTGYELPLRGDVLYLCRIKAKSQRDENETLRIAKREGKVLEPPTQFIDLHVSDDTGVPLTLRVNRFAFPQIGPMIMETMHVGDVILVRGSRIPNFSMITVKKIKLIKSDHEGEPAKVLLKKKKDRATA